MLAAGLTKKKKEKQNQASSCPVCCFPHCLTEKHSLTVHCQYSGKLISVIESFWKLSGCYLHGKALNPNHLTSKKHRKPQSVCRTTLIPGESTLNHWICQYELIPRCIPACLYQSCRRSRPQKTCLVISIFQTCAHFTKPLSLSETVMDQPPLRPHWVQRPNSLIKVKSCHWTYRVHPGYTNRQENFIHSQCSQRMLLNSKCPATPSTRTISLLNHNPQPPHISMAFECSPFLPSCKTASTTNCLYRYHHVRHLASMGHGNGETAISALSLRKKKK